MKGLKTQPYFEFFPKAMGIATICMFGVGGVLVLLGVPGKPKDSLLWIFFLLFFPVFIYLSVARFRDSKKTWLHWISSLLIVLLAAATGSRDSLAAAAILCLTQIVSEDPKRTVTLFRTRKPKVESVLSTLQLWAMWAMTCGLIYDNSHTLADNVFSHPGSFGFVVALVAFNARVGASHGQTFSSNLRRVGAALVPVLLAVPLLLRMPDGPGAAYHLDFFVGPALLVAKGGWLLHDVPTQYGFLSELILARWGGMHSYGIFFRIIFAFLVVELVAIVWTWALLVRSAAAAFLLSGLAVAVVVVNPCFPSAPTSFPSIGPYRFFWVMSLILVVLLATRRFIEGKGPPLPLWASLSGSCLWILGCFWSAESAGYCTVTWLPVLATALALEKGSFRRKALCFATPLLAFLGLIWVLDFFYRTHLGVGPDWLGFLEYPRAYATGGLMAVNTDRNGPMWVPVFLEALLVLVAIRSWKEGKKFLLPVCAVALLGLWSTLSYFAARSHPQNLINLLPFNAMGWVIMIYLTAQYWKSESQLIWRYSVPFLTVPIALGFSDGRFPEIYHRAWASVGETLTPGAVMASHPDLLRRSHPEYDLPGPGLLIQAGVRDGDPFIALTDVLPDLNGKMLPAWLPVSPYGEYILLPLARRRHYLDLWYGRGLSATGGFLLFRTEALSRVPELFDFLRTHFKKVSHFEDQRWTLEKFEELK